MIGQALGSYRVLEKLGEGGMGEVFRARDTKLNRDVALKILPDAFATDPDRLARFTREAQVLASLNHPNIAAIDGLEDTGDVRALVMELVEGETLDARLKPSRYGSRGEREEVRMEREGFSRAGLRIDEVLPIARQIAEALEAAHEQGIIRGSTWIAARSPARRRQLHPASTSLRVGDGGGDAEGRVDRRWTACRPVSPAVESERRGGHTRRRPVCGHGGAARGRPDHPRADELARAREVATATLGDCVSACRRRREAGSSGTGPGSMRFSPLCPWYPLCSINGPGGTATFKRLRSL